MKTKYVFCTNEQIETLHSVVIDGNGEFVFTCLTKNEDAVCGRFFKIPANVDIEGLKTALELHKTHNEGVVTAAQVEEETDQKLSILDQIEDAPVITDES